MTGQNLFEKLSKRDFSNSPADEYAQLLQTLHHHLFAAGEGAEFYEFLSKAHSKGKYIEVVEPEGLYDELFLCNLKLSSD